MRLRTLSLVWAAAALAGGAALPDAVRAASYDVVVCKGSANSGTAFATLNPALSTVVCPSAPGASFSGLVAREAVGPGYHPTGTRGGFVITAPAGTMVTQVAARRYFGKDDNAWSIAVRTADGQILETCEFNPALELSCSRGVDGDPQHPENSVIYPQLSTAAFEFGFTCRTVAPAACSRSAIPHSVWMVVYDATVTIDDPSVPLLGQPTGALLGRGGLGGWHRGVETASVTASDASGIARTFLAIDARPYASADQGCDYTRPQPCPASVTSTHSIDLSTVADGVHQLRVSATDAAGQTAVGAAIELKVDNHAPLGPEGVRATLASEDRWALSWVNPSQAAGASIVAARYAICRALPSADCPVEGRTAGLSVTSLDVSVPPGGGEWDALVWLEDEAGNQDRGAGTRVPLRVLASALPPPSGLPPAPPPEAIRRRSAGLKMTALSRRGRRIRAEGTVARAATGRVTVRVRARRGGRVLVRAQALVRRGRWQVRATLPSTMRRRWGALVTVSYTGDVRHVPQAIARRIGGP